MRKRLKKKFELGPYKRFGFDITGKFAPNIDKEKIMWDLVGFLEERKMTGAIGFHPHKEDFNWYIDAGIRKTKPLANKKIVLEWIKDRDNLVSFKVSQLHDIDDLPFYP